MLGGIVAVLFPPDGVGAAPSPAPVVRIPFPQEDGSLTPYTFELGYPLLTLVYDTLFWRDSNGVPQPWLATSADASSDGRRLVLHLAAGVTWHDGFPLTADDVVFSFRLFMTRPHPRFTAELSALDRVDAPDPATVVFTLEHRSPGFYDQPLADVPIVPAHLWRGLRPDAVPDGLPVGSGPYRLVEHRDAEMYRFEANPTYFRGRPAVDGIEVPIIPQAEATLRALERREVDMLAVGLPEQAAARLDSLGVRVAEGPSYVGTALVFNVRRPPFDRVEVRQAVAEALDLGRIARPGGNVPADNGYLHPASPWSSSERLHAVDQAGARAALAGLGLPPVRILVADNDPVKAEAARLVAVALQSVGVAAEATAASPAELAHALGEDGSRPTFDAAIGAIPPLASYDPDFLGRVFGSDPARAPFNAMGYRSPAFDALVERVETAADDGQRRAAVGEELGLLATDLPVVPLYFAAGAYAYRYAIHDGWVFVKGTGILDKQSFMSSVRPDTGAGAAAAGAVGQGSTSGPSPLFLAAVMALVAASVLVLVALRRGR